MYAVKQNIQNIFNRSWDLVIPFFQRSYVWSENEWDRFLDDMYAICQDKQEFFLGSVILKKESEQVQDSTVIDGQQRLTTLVLFFKVMSLKQDRHQDFDNFFKKIDDGKSIIKHNKNDRKSFEMILNLGLLQKIENPNNQVEHCYNFFVDYMDEEQLSFNELLKYIAFVGIGLEYHENEKQIFDTINSLGVKLTDAQIIKSAFFNSDEVELYHQYWESVFEKDSETIEYWDRSCGKEGKTLIDIFLFAFLQMQSRQLSPKDRDGFHQVKNLVKSYKKIISNARDKKLLLADLEKSASIFKKHISPDIKYDRLETQIDRINLIIFEGGFFSVIPYFSFLLTHFEHAPEQRDETLVVLESYLMRRMIGIDKSTFITKDYTNLFGVRLIVNDIVSAHKLKTHFKSYKPDHLNSVPSNNEIILLLKNKSQTSPRALLILYLLDNKVRQLNNKANILYAFDTYSIEYLMPAKWQKNWPRPIDDDVRKTAIRTLGNMAFTPIRLSSSLKDGDWQTRVNGKGKAKGLLDYNHFSLVRPLLNKPQWDDEDIFKNNQRLANYIIKVWNLD